MNDLPFTLRCVRTRVYIEYLCKCIHYDHLFDPLIMIRWWWWYWNWNLKLTKMLFFSTIIFYLCGQQSLSPSQSSGSNAKHSHKSRGSKSDKCYCRCRCLLWEPERARVIDTCWWHWLSAAVGVTVESSLIDICWLCLLFAPIYNTSSFTVTVQSMRE